MTRDICEAARSGRLAGKSAGFVMLPVAVIDELMPSLRDTELRVLLVVLRQTLGRRQPNGESKEADWLTHSQLKARTGRAGEAVSAAVDALERRGLILVRLGGTGKRLTTAAERRRAGCRRAHLEYSPGPVLWASGQGRHPVVALVAQTGKAKTTENSLLAYCRSRNSDAGHATPEDGERQTEHIQSIKAQIRARLSDISARHR